MVWIRGVWGKVCGVDETLMGMRGTLYVCSAQTFEVVRVYLFVDIDIHV